MIQLSTQPPAGMIPGVRAAGFPLGTTSDFALALAQLAGAPPGSLAPVVGLDDPRQVSAESGNVLPMADPVLDLAMPVGSDLGTPLATADEGTATVAPVDDDGDPVPEAAAPALFLAIVPEPVGQVSAPLASQVNVATADAAPAVVAVPQAPGRLKKVVAPASEPTIPVAAPGPVPLAAVPAAIPDGPVPAPRVVVGDAVPPVATALPRVVRAYAAEARATPVRLADPATASAPAEKLAQPVASPTPPSRTPRSDGSARLVSIPVTPAMLAPTAPANPTSAMPASLTPVASPLVPSDPTAAVAAVLDRAPSPRVPDRGDPVPLTAGTVVSPRRPDQPLSLQPAVLPASPPATDGVAGSSLSPPVSLVAAGTAIPAAPFASVAPALATALAVPPVVAPPATSTSAVTPSVQPTPTGSIAVSFAPVPTGSVASPPIVASIVAAPSVAAPTAAAPIVTAPPFQTLAPTPVTVTVATLPATPPLALSPQPASQAFAAAMFAAVAPVDRREDRVEDAPSPTTVSGTAPAATQLSSFAVAAAGQGQQPTLDMTKADWLASMIDRIETLRDDTGGIRETRMKLAPEALGNVEVTVRRDESGVLQVRIAADTAQARAMLNDAAPKLAEMVEARGLKLGGSSVDAGAGDHRRDAPAPTPTTRRPVATATDTTETADATSDSRLA